MNPLISVIVPCYNQAQYLDECLQSVLDQTYTDWECIIVNDGSQDNTEEIAKKWLEKDSRFRYIDKENGGLSSARNAGLKEAKGEWIQFLDSDDFIASNKFEIQLKDLKNYNVSICDYVKINNYKEKLYNQYCSPFSGNIFNYNELIIKWENSISIPCHCVIFRKTNLFFNEQLVNHEDWVFWLQLFKSNKIIYNFNILAFYRIAPNSISRNIKKMNKGFLKACNLMYYFYEKENEKVLMDLIIQKKKSIANKKNIKTRIAEIFPYFYNCYKKCQKKLSF